jgi:hypothetical protein
MRDAASASGGIKEVSHWLKWSVCFHRRFGHDKVECDVLGVKVSLATRLKWVKDNRPSRWIRSCHRQEPAHLKLLTVSGTSVSQSSRHPSSNHRHSVPGFCRPGVRLIGGVQQYFPIHASHTESEVHHNCPVGSKHHPPSQAAPPLAPRRCMLEVGERTCIVDVFA